MNAVFADAFYFVARLNRHDQHHERTLAFSRDFRAHLLTTDWVLMEVADALGQANCPSNILGAIHHVMKRGDQREAVFRDNEDRQSFLATLEPACRNTDWLAADPFLSRRAISNLEHLHLA